ncbi:hypothetical protein BV25DRAFT_1912479 [Artomyces pyxidatus]|uniref:Uncharacterized protein n=1 Tax=Artomyces pyxidatus TaxID=48021 RepID=A0ACB8TDF4_9AGAM|nr:hypothetical protein BV25DRAFT_1912479 [Artomyces pyxidatus]
MAVTTPSRPTSPDGNDARPFWDGVATFRAARYGDPTPSGSASKLLDVQRAFDHELDAMHLAMCSFRMRRNEFALVSRLPVEIMIHIFSLLADAYPAGVVQEEDTGQWVRRLGWIQITFVCRRWRFVALDHPHLWRDVKVDLPGGWTETMISRSKSARLRMDFLIGLEIRVFRVLRSRQRQVVLQHIHRIELLRLPSSQETVDALTAPAPMLQVLEIGPRLRTTSTILPANFLGNHAPILRHLLLYNVLNFPWSSDICKSLVSLKLESSESIPSRPPLDVVLHALNRMPSLDSLTLLRHHLPEPMSASSIVVRLPRITELTLEGRLPDIAGLLRQLELPNNPNIYLTIFCSAEDEGGDFHAFFSVFAICLRDGGTSAAPNTELFLKHNAAKSTFKVQAKRSTEGPTTTPKTTETFLEFSYFNEVPATWSHLDMTRGIFAAFASEHLQSLTLVVEDSQWTTDDFINISGYAPALRSLRIWTATDKAFCLALSRTHSTGTETRTSHDSEGMHADHDPSVFTFFPQLQFLEICTLNFVRAFMADENDPEGEGPSCDTFHACLLARAQKVDSPLKKLVLRGCKIRQQWVDRFKEAVDVKWDGTGDPDAPSRRRG